MRLIKLGKIIESTWHDIPNHNPHIELDAFIIMPNHVHCIIIINDFVGAGSEPSPTRTHDLSEIIRQFKTYSTRRINQFRNTPGASVWQRNFYDHIIREEDKVYNALKWESDKYYKSV